MCRVCTSIVNSSRKSLVSQHLKNSSHVKRKETSINTHSLYTFTKKDIKDIILDGFTGANIPLYKLRNENIIKMFDNLNISIPCETTIRKGVEEKLKTKRRNKTKTSQ